MAKPISLTAKAADCPVCGAYSQLIWLKIYLYHLNGSQYGWLDNHQVARCTHCGEYIFWKEDRMIYPSSGSAPLPNIDLPEYIRSDYEEARNIVELSPRGAVALLRLCVQKLCKLLGEPGENINLDIKNLVAKGLPVRMQQALDSVRVIGNNAVHPGQIDLTDNREIAYKLFAFINIIADILITQPKQIDEFYTNEIPESAKAAIDKRDTTQT